MNETTVRAGALVAGSVALASLLLYGGIALALSETGGAEATLWTLFAILLTIAGVYGLSRMGVSRVAAWTAFVVLGLAPIAAFVGWLITEGLGSGILAGILWLNLIAGLATAALSLWSARTVDERVTARRRVARIG